MDLRRLRYFIAVAETGNISKAAQKLFITQPALSRQIKTLEDEIGKPLFERQPHSIRLTAAAEALLPEARELLRHADAVLEKVRTCDQDVRLRIGYAPSLASGLLSLAVENFTQKHAGVQIDLLDLSSQEMLDGLQTGSLDVAISTTPPRPTRGLEWITLKQLHWQLAVPRAHPLAKVSKVSPRQMAAEPLLTFSRRDYPEYWNVLTPWLRQHGQSPTIRGEYDGITSLLAAVASGLGVAVVVAGSAEVLPRRVSLKALSTPPEPLQVAAGCREGRTADKSLAVFIAELRYIAASGL